MCRPDLRRVGHPSPGSLFLSSCKPRVNRPTIRPPRFPRPRVSALTMPSREQSSARPDEATEYSYRRALNLRELLPAIGIAVGAGLFAFYITRLLMQRTPLRVERLRRRPR